MGAAGGPEEFWLREARAALEDVLALEAEEGKSAARDRLEVLRQSYLGLREAGDDGPLAELDSGGRLDRQIARSKGVWVLWMVRSALGVLDFRELQRTWEVGEALTTAALREWLVRRDLGDEAAADQRRAPHDERRTTAGGEVDAGEGRGSRWPAFFDYRVYGSGLPLYELRSATARAVGSGFSVTVSVTNRGIGSVPAPAVIRTEEGARHTFSVSVPPGEAREATYPVLTRPIQAAVDPDGELLQLERGHVWRPVRLRRWWIF
jgi:hypothetical protein